MSRVYFHSISDEFEIRGSERAYLANKCCQLFSGLLDDWFWSPSRIQENKFVLCLLQMLPEDHYLRHSVENRPHKYAIDDMKTFLTSSLSGGDLWGIPKIELILNTALTTGGDSHELPHPIEGWGF